jgi:hypothetical protein
MRAPARAGIAFARRCGLAVGQQTKQNRQCNKESQNGIFNAKHGPYLSFAVRLRGMGG